MDQVEVAKVAALCRRGRRRHLADRGDPGAEGPRGRALGALRRPRTPLDRRPRRDGGRRASRSTSTVLGRLSKEFADRLAVDRGGDLPRGRPRVQHRLGPAAPAGPLRRAEAPRRSRRRPRASRAPTQEVLEELAAAAPPAPADRRAPPARQAQEHVSRRPARRWSTRRTAGSTPRSTRSSRRRAGSAPATRTCRISRSGPRTAARSARRSSPGSPGWSLLTADYSQIELRILAHYSQDPALVRAFARGERHPHGRRRADLRGARGGGRRRPSGGWRRRSISA